MKTCNYCKTKVVIISCEFAPGYEVDIFTLNALPVLKHDKYQNKINRQKTTTNENSLRILTACLDIPLVSP